MACQLPCQQTSVDVIPELSQALGFSVVLKREDLSCVGSHKFRPVGYQLEKAAEEKTPVVISTSGNAGIALAQLAPRYKVHAFVIVDPRITEEKLSHIEPSEYVHVFSCENAMRMANYISAKLGAMNLRPSKNDDALIGYQSLGDEILSQVPDVHAVFNYVTSGASLLGMDRAFTLAGKHIALHGVQSGGIASLGQSVVKPGEHGGALGVQKTRRSKSIQEAIERTGGQAWYASDEDILNITDLLKKYGVETSVEGAAVIASIQNASKSGIEYDASVVAVLSGATRTALVRTWEPLRLESFKDADTVITPLV